MLPLALSWNFPEPLPGEYITRVCGSDRRKLFSAPLPCENTKPKTSFVEPQGTTTPNHFSSKPFCSTHEHEPTKKDGSLSVFKYMLLLALLAVVLSSCGTSEPSYTKQSFMNAKEHSNTETLFQRNAEAFSYGNSIPKLILRRSKPSFQPSIPNIHLTSKHQPETGAVHCSLSDRVFSPLAERLLRLSSHHWGEQCTTQDVTKLWMCMQQIIKPQKFTWQANMAHGKKPFETVSKPLSSRNQNKFPLLTPRTTKHHQCFSYPENFSLPENQSAENLRFPKPIF